MGLSSEARAFLAGMSGTVGSVWAEDDATVDELRSAGLVRTDHHSERGCHVVLTPDGWQAAHAMAGRAALADNTGEG